jgi:photosystem II stability/assembly factor-like uncharacterized protein
MARGIVLSAILKRSGTIAKLLFCVGLLLTLHSFAVASDWRMIGPDGGNVRSLAYDPANPNHILIGTSAGQIFASQDGGSSWELFKHLGAGEDYVLDHIIFDPTNPATIYAAGWGLFNDTEGDVFRSDDGGLTWRTLPGTHGKSIRALAMAPSDHNTLVIGALDGVFRSRDGGETWERMTPENPEVLDNHASMKNFVSVAVDPQNPDIVYAGTRHLAWKTADGGQHWHNVKDGMLDDSDVFSIIVDPKTPSKVYASACSGIYKSDNGAELFHRVQGLPHSAIRTRVLKMDPQHSSTVYAGTTGGLWKTVDGGAKWTLVTPANVIVNDVLIDPRNSERVLIATDLGGVLASNDGFAHYAASNRGFSHRVVGDVVVDRKNPNRIYVGVVNDRHMGGVFVSDEGGKNWRQSNRGLEDRDILSLQQAENGTLFAGTNHGIFYLDSASGTWKPASMILGMVPEWRPKEAVPETPAPTKKTAHTTAAARKKTATTKAKAPVEPVIPADTAPKVRSLQFGENAWFAATNQGLFISLDQGRKWYGQPVEGEQSFVAVNSYADGSVTLATRKLAFLSRDWGKTWSPIQLPDYINGVDDVTLMPDSSLWVAAREGALESLDGGKTWRYAAGGIANKDVLTVRYDETGQRLLATALHEHEIFESKDKGQTWQRIAKADVAIIGVINYQGRLLAISSHNGLLLQDSDASAKGTEKAAASLGSQKGEQ